DRLLHTALRFGRSLPSSVTPGTAGRHATSQRRTPDDHGSNRRARRRQGGAFAQRTLPDDGAVEPRGSPSGRGGKASARRTQQKLGDAAIVNQCIYGEQVLTVGPHLNRFPARPARQRAE